MFPSPKKKKKKKNWKQITRDPADEVFSDFIRLRDGECKRCKKKPEERLSDRLKVKGLHCSHFFGRSKESVRFDPLNCDALCANCHSYWETTDREGYRDFKINQLGQREFDLLTLRANTTKKKDRITELFKARQLIHLLKIERGELYGDKK